MCDALRTAEHGPQHVELLPARTAMSLISLVSVDGNPGIPGEGGQGSPGNGHNDSGHSTGDHVGTSSTGITGPDGSATVVSEPRPA